MSLSRCVFCLDCLTVSEETFRAQCLLNSLLALPASTNLPAYYASLLVELCTQSPATVAPAMGKCVRKLYAGLGAGPENSDAKELLDPEGLRKFAEWFAMHLSNYNFVWRWPEWCVLSLSSLNRTD